MSGEFNIGDAVIVDNWGRGFVTRAPALDGTLELRTEDGNLTALVSEVQPSGDRSPLLRERLPYVFWICANKREVIANRNYRPIWSRIRSQMATPANPDEWINDIKQEIFLFDDQIDPWESSAERDRLEMVLGRFVSGGDIFNE